MKVIILIKKEDLYIKTLYRHLISPQSINEQYNFQRRARGAQKIEHKLFNTQV